MDILKTAIDWAKAEVFSSLFIIGFGLSFAVASLLFWQIGKTEMAKAYVYPTLVVGILLLTIGIGIFYANFTRVSSFEKDYNTDTPTFVKSEIKRTEQSLNEYGTIVFKIIPGIIVVAALLIIFLPSPTWRAISICTIALMLFILLIDSNANARLESYHQQLLAWSAT